MNPLGMISLVLKIAFYVLQWYYLCPYGNVEETTSVYSMCYVWKAPKRVFVPFHNIPSPSLSSSHLLSKKRDIIPFVTLIEKLLKTLLNAERMLIILGK